MIKEKSLKKSDLKAKQDLYKNFSNIPKEEKKEAINLIIKKSRNCTLIFAKGRRLLRNPEIDSFLNYFGIELS